MAVNVSNLTLGPATLYQGVVGATEPTDLAVNAAPAASAWTDVGGTLGGLVLAVKQTYTELMVDQVVDSVGRRLTKREIELKCSLAETTVYNIALALNGGTAASAATFNTYDPQALASQQIPTYTALIADGSAPLSATGAIMRRRIILRKTLNNASPTIEMAKDKQAALECTFQVHYVSGAVLPIHITDQTV